ncbi:MAG: efflux RND transporter periplasmic adaptor subunit [Gammaproteobacteria bacterium]
MNNLLSVCNKYKFWLILAVVVIAAVIWWLKPFSAIKNAQANQAIPVSVAKAEQKSVTVDLTAIGKIFPYSTVSIRSQVEGPIVEIHFARGQDVKVGDILFSIDPRPFEIALQQAEANLYKEKALLTDAQADSQRIKTLLSKHYASQENYDQVYSAMLAQEAAVRSAEADVSNAQLQLEYCTIRSPIDGRTGDILVNLGNLVKANDNQAMVIINQLSPIYASFDVPEKFLPAINRRITAGKVPVIVSDVNKEVLSDQGELFFVDNAIDSLTGTIELKANFPNKNNELWPGQFVQVELGLYDVNDAILIPTRAIQQGQKGSYIYVINTDNRAEYREIEIGEAVNNDTIVTRGLDAGEQVVVDGQFRLIDGSNVVIS